MEPGVWGETCSLVIDEVSIGYMESKGLNNKDKRRLVKVLWGWNADIICLQKTKLEGDVMEEVRVNLGRQMG